MKKLLRILIPCMLIFTILALIPSGAVLADGPENSANIPSIMDLYHTNPDLLKPSIRLHQVTASEMVYVTFDKDWLYQNDMSKDPYTVKITFPATWIQNSQSSINDGNSIILAVPKELLMSQNESKDPNQVSVTFPNDYFKGLPTPPTSINLQQESTGGNSTDAIEYQQRIEYTSSGTNILGAYGRVVPQYYYNPSSETFLSYGMNP